MGLEERRKSLNRVLQGHDSCLFVQETKIGRLDIYRKSSMGDSQPHFIFSITDDWSPKGRPVEWGVDIVLNRIKAHDLWRDENFVDTIMRDLEEGPEKQKRALKNSIESFMYDFHSDFKKATGDINTSGLKKIHKGE